MDMPRWLHVAAVFGIGLSLSCSNKKEKKDDGGKDQPPPATFVPSQTFNPNDNPNCQVNNFTQNLTGNGFRVKKEGVTVTINSTMQLSAQNGNLQSTSTATEAGRSGGFGMGSEQIAKALAKLGGTRMAQLMPGQWHTFYQSKGYPNVKCAVVPITGLTERSRDSKGVERTTRVNFEPAIPYFISPADGAVIGQELAAPMTFSNVKATLVEAGDSELGPGVYTGTVTINIETNLKPGATSAFRIKNSFTNVKTTAALGLLPEAVYHIQGNRYMAIEIIINEPEVQFLTPIIYQ